jgi:hypothetical protein
MFFTCHHYFTIYSAYQIMQDVMEQRSSMTTLAGFNIKMEQNYVQDLNATIYIPSKYIKGGLITHFIASL